MTRLDLIAGILLEVLECNADATAEEVEAGTENVPSAASSATRVRPSARRRRERKREVA